MIRIKANNILSDRLVSGLLCLSFGVLIIVGNVWAQPLQKTSTTVAKDNSALTKVIDPAKQAPGVLILTDIDFKRSSTDTGHLVLRFSGSGAVPDLNRKGSAVIIKVNNVTLPAALQKVIDVGDFATPVRQIRASGSGNETQLTLQTRGEFEFFSYQTGNDYIVEFVPNTDSADTTETIADTGGNELNKPVYSGPPVTFNFQDVPVRTVLQLIAEESDLNIISSDSVTGSVTLLLENVPWDQALDLILQSKGLDKRRNDNVIWVAPQAEIAQYEQDKEDARIAIENREETVVEYIPISYGSAEDIASLLMSASSNSQEDSVQGSGFLSSRGSISFDTRTNTLLVVDIAQRVESIKDLVRVLDKPVDQVLIEARIVIANESFARELGARFGVGGNGRNGDLYFSDSIENNLQNVNSVVNANNENSTIPPPSPRVLATIAHGLNLNLPASLGGAASSLAVSILEGGAFLDLELSALQQEGRGELVSNPRIVTSNQKKAVITQGEEIGYLTLTSSGSGGNAIPQVQFKEVVLGLTVTPTITADGRVFLDIQVNKDDVIEFINTGAGQVPRIATRSIDTAVLMENGQTVVIGGVYEFQDRSDLDKVPFLGDIPILGNLFKRRGSSKSKAELLIMITPKILPVAQN